MKTEEFCSRNSAL